ncbi:MAG: tetratricopeptide repeat protein [Myxococcota bacterium]|nr:tetratricopeptide repeat protein [Myxococcota bacterium]
MIRMSARPCGFLLLLLVWVSGLGCAHRGASAPGLAEGTGPIKLDGVVIRSGPDQDTGLEIYDAEQLFHLAGEAERKGDRERAKKLYAKLIEEFGQSRYWANAHFNSGLLYEQDKRFDLAAPFYQKIVEDASQDELVGTEVWVDAYFRIGVCMGKLRRWRESLAAFQMLSGQDWLDELDRMEALVGQGIAHQALGEADLAEGSFTGVLGLYRRLLRQGYIEDEGMAAEAAFRLAEISARQYHAVVLEYPVELLRARLEAKCGKLIEAQNRYLRAIRLGDVHTVAISGFRLGSLYQNLYDVIVGLSEPDDLTVEQKLLYQEEVRRKVIVLLKKAIRIFEKSLLVGRRLRSSGHWLDKLEQSLESLNKLYLEEEERLEAAL